MCKKLTRFTTTTTFNFKTFAYIVPNLSVMDYYFFDNYVKLTYYFCIFLKQKTPVLNYLKENIETYVESLINIFLLFSIE